MGFTHANIGLADLSAPAPREEVELMVDTGALYSIVPAETLRRIGIQPRQRLEFELANGGLIERAVGDARFFYDGRDAASPVIFGEPEDPALLGVVTLEAMGLEVDPVRKQIRPTRLILY